MEGKAKTCAKCGAHFLDKWCKPCKAACTKAWFAKNQDKVKERKAAYYKKNREKSLAYAAAYRAENQEKTKAANNAWRAANPEYKVIWRSANPDAHRIEEHNRRARKRKNGGKLSAGLAERLFNLQRGKCACGCKQPLGDDYHLDHIMPLALGGLNTDDNIQLLRSTCNLQKSAKHPIEFMRTRGFLL